MTICMPVRTLLPAPNKAAPCCWEAVESDGAECSCWEEIYWPEPQRPLVEGPAKIRDRLCVDCAYRPGSPERAEEDGDQLDAVPHQPFTCHQGMPVLVGLTHPKVEGLCMLVRGRIFDRDNFGPITRGTRAWKADGTTADLCAGWAGVVGVRPRRRRDVDQFREWVCDGFREEAPR